MDVELSETCLCSASPNPAIELSQKVVVIGFSVLAIISNVLTGLVLGQVRKKSSTETILLSMTVSELALPLIVLARYLYISFDDSIEDFPYFRVALFYAWNVFYVASNLQTLLLAARRYMAIEYAVAYRSLERPKTIIRTLLIIYVLVAVLFSPVLFYKPDFVSTDGNAPVLCSRDLSKEVIYTSIMMATVYLKGGYTAKIDILLYSSIYIFQLVSPLILAVLTYKFVQALRKSASKWSNKIMKKTKSIMIVSALIVIRDLPLGLLSTYFIFFLPAPACLTTLRLLTQELVIIMCAMNFVVLYYTNQKFQDAVTRLKAGYCSCDAPLEDNVFSSGVYRATTTTAGAHNTSESAGA